MRRSSQLASQVEKAVLNWLEARVLQPWVGHNFEAVVLSADQEKNKASAFLTQPPVLADVVGAPPEGHSVHVSLITADPDAREVKFARSEEHTSELQSRGHLVCRLLLEK